MSQTIPMHIIAHMQSDFPTKFGIPRQSGLAETESLVIFEPPYRNADALRGIEEFSHLWLIWQFSEAVRADWSPTVRPPKLGGNKRVGVFATRSPYRPNAIGLSSVRLVAVERHATYGTVLRVAGADLMDGTPVLDIKPYLAYTDSHPDAAGGFALARTEGTLSVTCPDALLAAVPVRSRAALLQVLAHDPRPGYQHEPDRVYGFPFAGCEVRFRVQDEHLTVVSITPMV